MKKLTTTFMVILLSAFWLHAYADQVRDPSKFFFSQTLGDFQDELQTAKAQGKKGIFLFFEQAECPFCHYMKTNVLNRKSVQDKFLKDYMAFTIDINSTLPITTFKGKDMSMKDFSFKVNHVRATPVMAFFDLKGNRIFRYTGMTRDMHEFLEMTDYVSGGYYKKESFNIYKRKHRDL